MSAIFAYCRVPTEHDKKNQIDKLKASTLDPTPEHVIVETIGPEVAAAERPEFSKLLGQLKSGDRLVVPKLDGLGRNANEIRVTVERLRMMGIRVHCLALDEELTSAAGNATMSVIAAVADFERELLIERTRAGMARAKEEGKHIGRPFTLSNEDRAEVLCRLAAGEGISRIARKMKTSRTTIVRIRDRASASITHQPDNPSATSSHDA